MNFFNNQGQVNASNLKDLVQGLVKYASLLEDNYPSGATLSGAPGFSDAKKEEILSKAINTQEGKVALAQAMANPIRRNLDYQGIARRTLVIDPLPQGSRAEYDRDIDVAAVVLSSNGAVPESRVFAERIVVPEFEVACYPTVRIHEVRRRRFNVIDRAVQKARQEIMAQEDGNIFAALDVAATVENAATTVSAGGLTKADLLEIKANIDQWDLVTSKFFMNIRQFNEILLWGSGGGQAAGTGGDLDPVSMREVLQTGLYGKIWGADIMVSKLVPRGVCYGCADSEFLGVLPVRQDIEVLPADDTRALKLGWVVNEIIGIGIVNPRAVAVGRQA